MMDVLEKVFMMAMLVLALALITAIALDIFDVCSRPHECTNIFSYKAPEIEV